MLNTGGSAAARYWDNFKHQAYNLVSDEPPEDVEVVEMPEDSGWTSELQEMSSLSYQQRLTAFFMSLGMGLCFVFISTFFASTIVVFPKKFAFFLTVGNIFCLGSTAFLVGFRQQIRSIFDAKRLEAAILFVTSVILTLVATLYWKSSIIAVIFAVVQVFSTLWYALSYVPFARHTVGLVWRYAWTFLSPVITLLGHGLQQCCGLIFSIGR
ncbi:Vesicle transport protein [Trypanosoma melophagium]|uniref:Vesicle transport protein n=1 Tax=Trypanosoma melophagium TaxID=715481 RepID=UPI00351A33D6|nr:Vesicle transport protein [Trypanosoma melophagium]